jgi:dienelactone hydrolase
MRDNERIDRLAAEAQPFPKNGMPCGRRVARLAAPLCCGLLALALGTRPAPLQAEPPAPAKTSVLPVTGQGFVADFISSPGAEKKMGILVLGGSEGGKPTTLAAPFAEAGYPALAVGYFRVEGRPATLEEIDLEYFDKPIAWLLAGGRAAPGGIIVVGASKGAELALLLASRKPEIKGVIAISPSSVVWQGIPASFWPTPPVRSSWRAGGKPLAFVPYAAGFIPDPANLVELYRRSLENREAARAAAIPVEKINGPILLLAGADDTLWPAAEMGEAICARLKANGFRFSFQQVVYPQAGHTLNEKYMFGGTADGNRRARLDIPVRIAAFLSALEAGARN